MYKSPIIIGLAGGTASGKTTVAATLVRSLGHGQCRDQVVTLSQESFYRDLTEEEIAAADRGMFNFDHPDAFDCDLMETTLKVIVALLLLSLSKPKPFPPLVIF